MLIKSHFPQQINHHRFGIHPTKPVAQAQETRGIKEEDAFCKLVSIVYTLLSFLQKHPLAMQKLYLSKSSRRKGRRIGPNSAGFGFGPFGFMLTFHHDPNVRRVFQPTSGNIEYRALKPIAAGEELRISTGITDKRYKKRIRIGIEMKQFGPENRCQCPDCARKPKPGSRTGKEKTLRKMVSVFSVYKLTFLK